MMDNKVLRNLMSNVSNVKLSKLKIKFDITTLDLIIAFIYKDSVLKTRKSLKNIEKLFLSLDSSLYEDNPQLNSRIWVIKTSLYARLTEGIDNVQLIKTYCIDSPDCDEFCKEIVENSSVKKISFEDSKYLLKKVEDALEFGYTITVKEIMDELLHKVDDEDFKSYKGLADDLYEMASAIINIRRSTRSMDSRETFSLDEDVFDSVVEEAVNKLKDRNRILMTGIRRWNTLLAPGYMSKRLYLYLAFPGKGKSTILLKSALDIRRYNKGIKTKDPDKRPAVLFLTLENSIEETIERIYNMTVDSDDIRNYTPKQIKSKLKKEGQLKLTDEDNINIIIKEYKDRELETNDIYTIIDDLSDEGMEVISCVIDYIKRLRPSSKTDGTEKQELKFISNELKEIAKYYDISVITAQQLNRSGAAVVDAALQANKEDVTRLVGRDAIASAWELLENADFTCIINPEIKTDTEELFLTFKMLKRRYRSSEDSHKLRTLEYFNHPFEKDNEIRLRDDVELPKSLSLDSLATQFSAVENKDMSNATKRENKKENKSSYIDKDNNYEYEPFNTNQSKNF